MSVMHVIKEMRTWDRFNMTSYCICDWHKSGELGGWRSS